MPPTSAPNLSALLPLLSLYKPAARGAVVMARTTYSVSLRGQPGTRPGGGGAPHRKQFHARHDPNIKLLTNFLSLFVGNISLNLGRLLLIPAAA